MNNTAGTLTASGVHAAIGGATIVREVSFTATPGTMTAIVGINGVGKSTLLRTLTGLAAPTAGEVTCGEDNLHAMAPTRRARALAFVGQEEQPPADLTVGEVVHLGRLPHTPAWRLGGKRDQQTVTEALAQVGMAEHIDTPSHRLSGGQRRRVLIARGLAQDTPIMVLDEPTNHLDVHYQLHVLKILRDSHRTIVATVHDVDLALAHFDQVVVLHQGHMFAAGNPTDILTADVLREVFDVAAYRTTAGPSLRPHLIIDSL